MKELDSSAIKILFSTRKILVLAVMLGLVGLILVSSVIVPQFQQTMDLYKDMQREEPKLEKLQQKLAALEQVQFSPEYAQIEVVEEALPSKKPLLELMVSLNSVSQETGVVVTDFQLSPGLVASDSTQVASKAAYDQLKLDLNVEGTFDQIQDFLLRVEQASPFSTITLMNIGNQINTNSAEFIAEGEDAVFQAELQTETYFFTQPIEARVEAPLPTLAQKELDVLAALAAFRPTDLEEQTEIRGGGLQDLFQLSPQEINDLTNSDSTGTTTN